MKAESATIKKLVKDGLISIVLYALPVLLMLLTFKITGKHPWTESNKTAVHQSK